MSTYYSGQTTNYTTSSYAITNQQYGSSVGHSTGIISSFVPGTFLNPQPVGTHSFRKSRWQHGITWDVPNTAWTSEGWSKCLTHETASSERQEWKLMLAPWDTIITSLKGEVLYDIKGNVISLGVGDELIIPAHMVYQLKVNGQQNAILCWAYRVEATREVPKPKGKWIGRDIFVIVDSSASMSSQDPTDPQRRRYWQIARDAVMNQIVTKAIQHDKDGITLYFFDSKFTAYDSVNSTSKVGQIFNQYQPTGSTALHLVLKDAFGRYFGKQPLKPATFLIITDGSPDSKEEAENEIIQAARRVTSDYDLLVIFVQIGPDQGATQFLQYLDSGISRKTGGRDIVEVVKSWEMKGVSFEELISNTMND